jgi:hypothetical protein
MASCTLVTSVGISHLLVIRHQNCAGNGLLPKVTLQSLLIALSLLLCLLLQLLLLSHPKSSCLHLVRCDEMMRVCVGACNAPHQGHSEA